MQRRLTVLFAAEVATLDPIRDHRRFGAWVADAEARIAAVERAAAGRDGTGELAEGAATGRS